MPGKLVDPSLVQKAAEVAGSLQARPDASSQLEDATLGAESLSKATGSAEPQRGTLAEVMLLLEWTNPGDQAAQNGQQDYLDGSCMVYSEERLIDVVDFRGAHSVVPDCAEKKPSSASLEWSAGKGKHASVLHSGDVMSPEGGTHVIRVSLKDLPAFATDCFFVISAYNCRNLSMFRSLSMRLFNVKSAAAGPLTSFTTADAGNASAALVCGLMRKMDVWHVRTFGKACDGTIRDYAPIESTIAPVQENHCRWRRRRPFILLEALWRLRRAVLWDERQEEKDLVVTLIVKLHPHLFQEIMEFV